MKTLKSTIKTRHGVPSKKSGFTMIELLVAATILAVLSVVGVVSYTNINKRSRDSKRLSDLEQMRSALEMFRADQGYYPAINTAAFATAANLNTGNSSTGLVSTYMPAIPTDPKDGPGQIYQYRATNLSAPNYYGYCLCAKLEGQVGTVNTCTIGLPADCNYGLKNP